MLTIKEGILGCLFAVNINGSNCKNIAKDIDSKLFCNNFVEKQISKSYEDYLSTLNFVLSGGGIIKEGVHYELKPSEIPMDLFGQKNTTRNLYAFCSIHAELNLAVFSFNIDVSGLSTPDVITLNQAIYGGYKIKTFNKDLGEYDDLLCLMKAYMDSIKCKFPKRKSIFDYSSNSISKEYSPYVLIEIKEITHSNDDLSLICNPTELIKKYSQEFYGIITGDEGYEFVPKQRCDDLLSENWTTRDFFVTIPFLMGSLSINLANSKRHSEYLKLQQNFNESRYREVNKYFNVYKNKIIAGLSHGVAIMVEEGLVVRRLLDRILLSKVLETNKDMGITFKTRKKIITTINRIASLNIMEIDSLEKLIISKMNILQDLEKVKYNLDLNQSEIDIKYSRTINAAVILFTILQIIIAIYTIFLS
ncbi:MAG: hypothetical protein WDA47_00685 [Bacilli bacterium]